MIEVPQDIFTFVIVGFLAQLIDGSLGMGYKTSATAFLLSVGLPPVLASSSVHTAGVATSAASGLAHLRMGNVNTDLLKNLVIPGVVGGILGVILLANVPSNLIKPAVAIYLILMGLRIVRKSLRRTPPRAKRMRVTPLAMMGGFFDAVGGGGWGPIVTGTMIANDHEPRFVIGSVNLAEFFVTLAQTVTFFFAIGTMHWTAIVGLMIGGVTAAPIAAYICKHLPIKRMMLLVGLLVVFLSSRTLYFALFPAV